MLTAMLLLSLAHSDTPQPTTTAEPARYACESASVVRGALVLDLPDWAFVLRPETSCEPSTGAAVTMYALDIDPMEPVEVTELDADIYEGETP